MRRIYISCTNRVERPENSPRDHGDAYVIDWDTKKVIHHLDVYGPEDIQVGRSRGCGGIAWHNNKIYIACRSGLSVFDPDTLKYITQVAGVGSGIHEIKSKGNRLYVTNTSTDSFTVLEKGKVIEQVYIREKDLAEALLIYINKFVSKKNVNCGANKLHFNSLAWDGNGDMYHLYMAGGIIYNWSRKEIVYGPSRKGSMHHGLVLLDDNTFLINESNSGETILVDIASGTGRMVRKSVVGALMGSARFGWLRGMALHNQTNTLFLTTAPGKLIMVDTNTWEDLDSLSFSTQEQECPYGILLDPRDWRGEAITEWLVELGRIGHE